MAKPPSSRWALPGCSLHMPIHADRAYNLCAGATRPCAHKPCTHGRRTVPAICSKTRVPVLHPDVRAPRDGVACGVTRPCASHSRFSPRASWPPSKRRMRGFAVVRATFLRLCTPGNSTCSYANANE
eukprot:3970517-Prymnesium_polylepis.1